MTDEPEGTGTASPSELPGRLAAIERERWEHDVRNLLYLIVSLARLLRTPETGALNARQHELLAHILECAGQIRGLLDGAAGRAPRAGRKRL